MDDISVEFVRDLIEVQQKTTQEALEEILSELRNQGAVNLQGFSIRSLKRFMAKHSISRRISNVDLDGLVEQSVDMLGSIAGAKITSGYLRSQFGRSIGRNRVANSLRRIDPNAAAARQGRMNRLVNPKPYYGRYFGYNLHMDQNEKVTMFGVTIVMARDGFSGMIVGGAVMELKNNIVIYNEIYRKLTAEYGLWKRIIVDHGPEFFLSLNMHMRFHRQMDYVAEEDLETTYMRVPSKENNRIERMWVEVNQQVNYPIKDCVQDMVDRDVVDKYEDYQMFSVGEVIRPLTRLGLETWIRTWNNHIIPKRGRPIDFVRDSRTLPISNNFLITGEEAADLYRNEGGNLTDERVAPGDLLAQFPEKRQRRDRIFWEEELPQLKRRILTGQCGNVPQSFRRTFEHQSALHVLFGATTNRIFEPLQEAILTHIRISVRLCNEGAG